MKKASFYAMGIVVLIGGLGFADYGVPKVNAASPEKGDPYAGVTQRWDKNLPSSSRFTVLNGFGGAAVRDNNTGLVWEQTPSSASQTRTWEQASLYCLSLTVGGTAGWRLPSVVELKSIQDPSLPAPFIPTTVFMGVQSASQY